ncbi:MAG: peptidoglycan-binding protein [Clostridia bacterium]|nr:peptidoglycan-binding protein [Clostridia bacterium]
MEEYWNPDETSEEMPETAEVEESTMDLEPEEGEALFDEPVYEEPPKPKKKKSFKKKLRRMIRRFNRLPLVTKIIEIAAVVLILAAIVLLLILLPKSCGTKEPEAAVPTATPVATPEEKEPEATPAPTDVPRDPTATPFIIPALTQNLKSGMSDAAVIPYVRTRLVDLGYMEMPASNDALYDQETVNAIKRFQYRNFGDDVRMWDGIIGQTTYELLTSSNAKAFFMRKGDTDEKMFGNALVTKLQNDLKTLNYYKSVPTGTYDDTTASAVKSFQRANSLDADGVAGLRTLQLIKTLLAQGTTAAEPETQSTDAPGA